MFAQGRRRWLQFSVRTVLLCTLLCSIPLALLSLRLERTRRQRRAADAITAAGGAVWYVGPEATATSSVDAILPYDSQQPNANALERLVEEATAGDVVAVNFAVNPISGLYHKLGGYRPERGGNLPFDFDGQDVASDTSGQWVLHGDAQDYYRIAKRFTEPSKVNWQDVQALPGLEVLSLCDNAIDLTDLGEIGKLTQLRCLLIYNGRDITDAGLAQLSGLTKLRVLVIDRSQITDDGLKHLRAMSNLEVLELDHAAIRGDGLVHLAPLTKLRLISLRFTPLEDAGLKHLSSLTRLERLYLFQTRLTDDGLSHLSNLQSLQLLHVGKTEITFQRANAFEEQLGRSVIIR